MKTGPAVEISDWDVDNTVVEDTLSSRVSDNSKPQPSPSSWPRLDRTAVSTVSSFEEADRLDRAYWWSRTPLERLQALELSRQVAYGYGNGKPVPRFQRVLEIAELG